MKVGFSNTLLFLYKFEILILKKKEFCLVATSPNYFFKIRIGPLGSFIFYDKQSSCLYINSVFRVGNFLSLFLKSSKKVINSFFILSFRRVSYSGKGYRLYLKNKNFIYLQLGFSHKFYIFTFSNIIKIISRYKILVLGYHEVMLTTFLRSLVRIRSINIFTSKGFRFTKQIIYKKIGKVSSYI